MSLRLLALLIVLSPFAAAAQDFLTGRKLEDVLAQPATTAFAGLSRREVLQRVATHRRVAVLLDRRIDPSAELTLEAAGHPVRQILRDLLPKDADVRIVADVVYLGPEPAVGKLRTLIALRSDELSATTATTNRQLDLNRSRTISWKDLDTPQDVLKTIGETWDFHIEGTEQIPHDLWSGAALPNVTAIEALSLVLIQFDLTFAWDRAAQSARLVSVPEAVTVARRHTPPRGLTAKAAASEWPTKFPGVRAMAEGREVAVVGTIEQHEAIEELLRPPGRTTPAATARLPPLKLVRLKFRFDNTVQKLIETLTKAPDTQLVFEYDEAALKAAGIDLEQRIRFEVENATVDEVLHKALDPLKIRFEVTNRTVRLTPE